MPIAASSDSSASSSSSSTGLLNADPVDPSSGQFAIVPDAPITIPAGETQYFELDASVVPSDTPYSITTTLMGDPSPDTPTLQTLSQLPASTNFIWSPNTFDTASTTEPDWATGAFVYGLASGITETRGSPPVELPPTCTITTDQSAITPPSSVTVSWTSTDAQSAVWGDGTSALTEGSKAFLVTSAPHNFMLTVTGTYGVGECIATIAPIAPPPAPSAPSATTSLATSSAATSTPADMFSASTMTGPAPLAVTFKGTVNNALSCAATTYTFAYGDNSTTTVGVAAKFCKPVNFTLSHTYKVSGVYSAKLYRGAFPGTASARPVLIQTIVITATTTKAKVSATASSPLNNLAAAAAALNGQTILVLERFLQSFHSLFER